MGHGGLGGGMGGAPFDVGFFMGNENEDPSNMGATEQHQNIARREWDELHLSRECISVENHFARIGPKENCNPRSIESQLTASIDKAERPWLNIIALLMTVVMTLVQHEEAIRCIQEHLLGVPIQEELTALRNRVEIFEVKNASLRDTIRTIEAVETSTCNHERLARIEIERQLASVQESYHQDQEDDDNK
nr:hypothetical protein [Tanacetum cinerariifolium]